MIPFVYYKLPNIYLVKQKKVELLCDLGTLPGRPVPVQGEGFAWRSRGRLNALRALFFRRVACGIV